MLRRCLLAAVLATVPLASAAAQEEPETRSRASLVYGRTQFVTSGTSPWNVLTGELSTRGRAGTLVGRASLADRFGRSGYQVEADAYPSLAKGVYGYVNLGYSPSVIFPEWRFGAELFGNLPGAWELSAGFRRLLFEQTNVTLLTGSVGRYAGNYWISARPFVTVGHGDRSTTASLQGSVRRYFTDARHYVTLAAGAGAAFSEEVVVQELERLRSARVGVDGKQPLGGRALRLQWSAGFEREQLPQGRARSRLTGAIGLERSF